MKNYSIKQEKGNNLRQVVSRLLVKSPITAIKEFSSNSWDADSENVHIDIVDSSRQIIIEDDGTGMDESGLENFLSMGDSEKLLNPFTEKGRRKIGKFGIANTLLQFLGNSYKISSWKGNSYIDGFESFSPEPTGGIRYDVFPNPSKKHGTRILIEDSRFVGSQLLKPEKLFDALSWELPESRPDFKIYLNGEEIKRIVPEPLEVFEYHDELPLVGPVDTKISLYGGPVRINGLFVYVDQRSVGNPEVFQLRKALRISPTRVLVTMNADGLRDSIVFNREKMIEDEKFFEFKKYLHQKLIGIGRGERHTRGKAILPSRELISSALKQTSYLTVVPDAVVTSISNGSSPEPKSQVEVISQNSSRKYSPTGNGDGKPLPLESRVKDSQKAPRPLNVTGFRTVSRANSEAPATFNSSTRQLSYNQNHPLISSNEITNPDLLNMHILLATSLGVAEESYLSRGGSQDYLTKFNAVLSKVLSCDNLVDAVMQSRNSNETGRFAPSKEYSLFDLMNQGVVSIVSSRSLVRSGVFNPRNDCVLGKEVNDYIAKSANHTPAVDIIQYEWGKTQVEAKKLTRERIRQIRNKVENNLVHFAPHLPFIYNIGVSRPFFLVENEYVPAFLGLLSQRAFTSKVSYEPIEQLVERSIPLVKKILGGKSKETQFVSLDELCTVTRGSPYEVMNVVGYSQRVGINLPLKKEDDRILYSVHHFKKARIAYLEAKK